MFGRFFDPSRRITFLAAAAAVLLSFYLVAWLQLGWQQQGRTDFGNAYVGGEILRSGQGDRLYDIALQGHLHAEAIAPDREPNLPFLDAPPAAALAVPFTFLDVRSAWRLWSVLQLVCMAGALAIVAACAPWPTSNRRLKLAAVLLAASGIGTLLLAIQGQWAGLFALGVAAGYALWRRGNLALGAAAALSPILAVKPNLALGLAAFLLGWGNRRLLLGALAGVAGVALSSLALSGVSGTVGFIQAAAASTQQWPWSSMNGVTGVTGSLLGSGSLSTAIGLTGSLVAASLAFPFGRLVRQHAHLMEAALAGAIALTLLAAPHLYHHDLTLLAPAFVLGFAAATRLDVARQGMAPGRISTLLGLMWLAYTVVGFQQLSAPLVGFPGRLVPWFLAAFAAAAFWGCRSSQQSAARSGRSAAPAGILETASLALTHTSPGSSTGA